MRAPRVPPSSYSLLHLVCRHQPSNSKSVLFSRTLRPQCPRLDQQALGGSDNSHLLLSCSYHSPSSVRSFASAPPRCSGLQRPHIETDRFLSFLAPKELFSRRGQAGNGLPKWRRGLFGRKVKEEPSEKTMSSTYLDSGSDNSILGRHLLHKPNDMVLRCTEFDQDGKNCPISCMLYAQLR